MRVAPWVRVSVAAALGCLALAWCYRWAFGPMAPPADPTQSVRDSAARAHAADSVRWAVERQGWTATVQRLEGQRDSLRKLRNAKPGVVYVPVRDSRTANNPSSGAGLSDSTPMVHLADYQSLERENALADTVIQTQAAIIRADSLAYARLASLRAFEDSTHTAAYRKVARDLARARRGCRVLGLLPCPTITVGYGAALAPGFVTGPAVVIGFPLKL